MIGKRTLRLLSYLLVTHLYLVNTQTICPEYCSCEPSYDDIEIEVKCIDTDFSEIPSTIDGHNVNTLDFSSNELEFLMKLDLLNYTSLETLYLIDNNIKSIDMEAFSTQKKLRYVDLSENCLQYIHPHIFKNNHVLETVKLRDNPLVYVPENDPFIVSNSITTIDISSCLLNSVNPSTFSKLPNLRAVDISSNLMKELDIKSLDYLTELRILDVGNNMWNCDCHIVEVMIWLSKKRKHSGLSREHSPVKCLENGRYRTLWSAANANRTCQVLSDINTTIESSSAPKTEELIQAASGTIVKEVEMINVEVDSYSVTAGDFQMLESKTKYKAAIGIHPTKETTPPVQHISSWWDKLLDTKTITVFLVLLIMLVFSFFMTLIILKCYTKFSTPPKDLEIDKSAERNKRISRLPLLASIICNSDELKCSRISIDSNTNHVYHKIG